MKAITLSSTEKTIPHAALRQKLYADIGYDLSLPIASCAFYRQGDVLYRVSGAMPSVSTVFDSVALPCQMQEGAGTAMFVSLQKRQAFLEHNPHALSAYFSHLIYDLWIGNADNNSCNMAVSSAYPAGLYGFDFDKANPRHDMEDVLFVDMHDVTLSQFYRPHHRGLVEATLTAIQSYPESRLCSLVERLLPWMNDRQCFEQDVGFLVERQKSLRDFLTPRLR